MIGFHVRYGPDRAFNIADVRSFGAPSAPNTAGLRTRTAHFADGREVQLSEFCVDEILSRPMQLMPSEPGWSLCFADVEATDAPRMSRSPLIAWALCVDGSIRPVTPAGVEDGCGDRAEQNGWFVELPSGRIEAANSWAGYCSFDNEAEFLEYFAGAKRERDAEGRA